MSQLNKVRFQQFLKQAKGVRLQELHVNRVDKKKHAVLQYNGRAPNSGQRLTGEWQVPRDRDEADVQKDIVAFLEQCRKHFFVVRGAGLEDEAYADATQEAEVKPIVGEADD